MKLSNEDVITLLDLYAGYVGSLTPKEVRLWERLRASKSAYDRFRTEPVLPTYEVVKEFCDYLTAEMDLKGKDWLLPAIKSHVYTGTLKNTYPDMEKKVFDNMVDRWWNDVQGK